MRLETRPPNLEGEGEITMRDLVKNCLRMRPERIIVGEVRGPEVFDLLQAMNTGHDGSMGTIHSNSPRECLNRIESMIAMGGFSLPQKTVREIVVGSVDVIIQAARLRDGSRRITHITEVIGMEGDVIITQDLVLYDIKGEDAERQAASASTSRPASAGRISGTAPATTARSSAWPPRSRRWKSVPTDAPAGEHVMARTGCLRSWRSVALAAVSAGARGLCVSVQPHRRPSNRRKAQAARQAPDTERARSRHRATGSAETAKRRKSVQESVKELEQRQKAKDRALKKPPLRIQLRQAGMQTSVERLLHLLRHLRTDRRGGHRGWSARRLSSCRLAPWPARFGLPRWFVAFSASGE